MSPSASQTADPSDAPTSQTPLPKGNPLFVQPSRIPEPSLPSQTQESEHLSGTSQLQGEPSWSSDDPSLRNPGPDESSDTPSSGGKGVKLSKAGLRAGLGVGFRQICKVVAAFLADQEQREAGVWTPDEDDVHDVSAPAASLVYRRLPDDAKSGDLIDLFALGLAVVGYVVKNVQYSAELRTLRQLQAAQGIQPEESQG